MNRQTQSLSIRPLLLLAAAMSLAVLLAEGALRAGGALGWFPDFYAKLGDPTPPLNSRKGAGLYYVHPYASYEMKPGYRTKRVSINSLGFRGREFSLEKPPGEYRVVALGGSTTFGIYQWDRYTYPLALETALRRDLHTDRVQVVNAGLVCATTAENLHRMFTEIFPLDPDLIVIYDSINDLVPRVFNDFSMDYYHFRRVDPNNKSTLSELYLYRLALRALNPIAFHENYNLVRYIWKFENLPDTLEEKLANFERNSTAAFERNLDDMIINARARGVEVVLATFAIDKDKPNWMDYLPAELWPRGVDQNNEVIRRLSERYDLPLVEFSAYALTDKSMFYDSIHMTDDGSRLKGEFFARTIGPIVARDLQIPYTPTPG